MINARGCAQRDHTAAPDTWKSAHTRRNNWSTCARWLAHGAPERLLRSCLHSFLHSFKPTHRAHGAWHTVMSHMRCHESAAASFFNFKMGRETRQQENDAASCGFCVAAHRPARPQSQAPREGEGAGCRVQGAVQAGCACGGWMMVGGTPRSPPLLFSHFTTAPAPPRAPAPPPLRIV